MAVTNRLTLYLWLALGPMLFSPPLLAIVLPEDRADLLFHSYSGGGADISGPSLLVRKKFSENLSATLNHYVDNVSSASIDVVTSASAYSESRNENSLSLDFLNEKTLMTLGYARSEENDFDAATFSLNISQDMFGDLTTVSIGYAQGDNTVRQNDNPGFSKDMASRSYRLSLSQVISKDFLMALAFDTITDQGYLNNPYRSVRFINNEVALGYSYQTEVYPNTRNSNSLALRGRYYLPHRAALSAGYRFFTDTWGMRADTYELGYTLPYAEDWIFEFTYRYYRQGSADFFSDLFAGRDAQSFLARDKELSRFTSQTFGLGSSYEFKKNGFGLIKRGSLNLNLDLIRFDYDNFRDLTVSASVGEEPLYSFDASVIRLFLSIWF